MIFIYNLENPKECILFIWNCFLFFSIVQVGHATNIQDYIQIKVRHPAQILHSDADDIYKISIASKGMYAIYCVSYELCWISMSYKKFCSISILRVHTTFSNFGREVVPPHFLFQLKSTSHTEVTPLHIYFGTYLSFSCYRRGQWSAIWFCHSSLYKAPHASMHVRKT